MRPEDVYFDLKVLVKDRPEGIPMFLFREIETRKYSRLKNPKRWSSMMRYLVNKRKIEVFGPNQMVRPVTNDIERNVNKEIKLDDILIKDILSEISPCKPIEAYKYCLQKHGWCNSESFTRKMRRMAEQGLINRDDKGQYSIGKIKTNPIHVYTKLRVD